MPVNWSDRRSRLRALHVMAKPIGPICNLDCSYCFYLDKTRLYPDHRRWAMDDAVLEEFIRQYIDVQEAPEVNFAWQGGEPTLLGVRYFQRVVELQQRHARGKRITNALQTNGTLLDDAWCRFLYENAFLVGISIDGPRELHDAYRKDKQGRPTFDRVMQSIERLQRHHVEFNILTVVNRLNGQQPLEVYRFFRRIGARYLQFIPLVERLPDAEAEASDLPEPHALAGPATSSVQSVHEARVTDWSVEPEQYGAFLCAIYDEWIKRDVGTIFVQAFDVALGIWAGNPASLCVFAETCGASLAMEHNGDIYACDHYVYPEYRLGNLMSTSMIDLADSEQQRLFGSAKRDRLPDCCRRCPVLFACRGECPKHRFMSSPDGEDGLNYLCPSYKRFFTHIDPTMRDMVRLLERGRAPAEIMSSVQRLPAPGRNDPCRCGSGRKYKRCCGAIS